MPQRYDISFKVYDHVSVYVGEIRFIKDEPIAIKIAKILDDAGFESIEIIEKQTD